MATPHLPPRSAAALAAAGLCLLASPAWAEPPSKGKLVAKAELPARAEASAAEAPSKTGPPEEAEAAPEAPAREAEPAWQREPAVRRSGFTAGVAGGLLLGSSAGFPNDAKKIGLERYYTETGVGLGSGGMIWIGGALTDWFTFGFAVGTESFGAGGNAVSMSGFSFHIEAFPLFPLGGQLRELGVMIDTGTGGSVTKPDGSSEELIDGGAVSHLGWGAFYEGFRLWKISAGPFIYGDYSWSASVRQPGLMLGLRTVIYTGPPSKKP
ncbi:MAG: hypothetical protein IT372_02060 [Polyangiaceae bacterium]|nr:hypothetical protein [Polyangiaceae bacterium]